MLDDIRKPESERREWIVEILKDTDGKHTGFLHMGELVRCEDCRKSHIDGKTTHYLWCTEWGRSTDTFGYCERGEREGE